MKKIILLTALLCSCISNDAPVDEPTTIGVGHCGVAPLAPVTNTWVFQVDNTLGVIVMDPLEYAKVQAFRGKALDWMRCTIAEYHEWGFGGY